MEKEVLARKIQTALQTFSAIELAIVFGSRADGRETADSDLDVAVAAGAVFSVDEKLAIAECLSNEFGCEVDLVDLQSSHGALLQEVLTRGKVVIN